VKAGDLVLVHAAAGGVGQILCRWAKALGATVVGTVGSEAKVAVALAAGADHVINYSTPGWSQAFIEVMGGRKADVVYLVGEEYRLTTSPYPIFDTVEDLRVYLEAHPLQGRSILLKGSRSTKMETLLDIL
jgi:hypothetical protein